MPTATLEALVLDSPPPRRKLWTRADCEALASLEAFHAERLELIEGELIEKMSKSALHSFTLALLVRWLASVFGHPFVQQEPSIDVSPEDHPTNQREPDIIVLTKPMDDFAWREPGPSEIRLLVEVSRSTLREDVGVKARLYARAGFPDYWVADIKNRCVHVHCEPANGVYQSVLVYAAHEDLSPLATPDATLRAGSLFPPPIA